MEESRLPKIDDGSINVLFTHGQDQNVTVLYSHTQKRLPMSYQSYGSILCFEINCHGK